MKLTEKRRRILTVLNRINEHSDCCPTSREIAEMCGEGRRASDWANGALGDLHHYKMAAPAGRSFSNAVTWRITDAGRLALHKGTGNG